MVKLSSRINSIFSAFKEDLNISIEEFNAENSTGLKPFSTIECNDLDMTLSKSNPYFSLIFRDIEVTELTPTRHSFLSNSAFVIRVEDDSDLFLYADFIIEFLSENEKYNLEIVQTRLKNVGTDKITTQRALILEADIDFQ